VSFGDGAGTLVFEGVALCEVRIHSETRPDGWQYLVIGYGNGDTVAIQGGFLSPNQAFEFSDGSYTHAEFMRLAWQLNIAPLSLNGSAGNDVIYGSDRPKILSYTNETLWGRAGNDHVQSDDGTLTQCAQMSSMVSQERNSLRLAASPIGARRGPRDKDVAIAA
jgi:hypothetical protein